MRGKASSSYNMFDTEMGVMEHESRMAYCAAWCVTFYAKAVPAILLPSDVKLANEAVRAGIVFG